VKPTGGLLTDVGNMARSAAPRPSSLAVHKYLGVARADDGEFVAVVTIALANSERSALVEMLQNLHSSLAERL
jgi:hypothetical protein